MQGSAGALASVHGLAVVARRQAFVLTRAQLAALGVRPHHVDNQLRARRWQLVTPQVVVLHNGPLDRPAMQWVAVLEGGPTAALGSWTVLGLHGLRGWDRDEIHLVVPRGARPMALPGVVVHESRRHFTDDICRFRGLPVHSVSRAAIDAAAWSRSPRTALGLLAAVVQQDLTTTDLLHDALDVAGAVQHRRLLRLGLADIAGGADSLAEIDFVQLCRRAGLPEPIRQSRRTDARGRTRYLDVEWRLPGGRRLVIEIDGMGHIDPRRWYDDLMRTAELPTDDSQILIRVPSTAARLEPERILAIVERAFTEPAPVRTT